MKTNRIILASAISLLTLGLNAQEELTPKQDIRKAQMMKIKEEREAKRIEHINNELNLTEDEKEKFWATHNKMEAELKALKKAHKIEERKKIEDLSDEEAEELMQSMFSMKEKELEIRKKYHTEFKSILGVKRTAKFYHLDKDTNNRMRMEKPSPVNRRLTPENN